MFLNTLVKHLNFISSLFWNGTINLLSCKCFKFASPNKLHDKLIVRFNSGNFHTLLKINVTNWYIFHNINTNLEPGQLNMIYLTLRSNGHWISRHFKIHNLNIFNYRKYCTISYKSQYICLNTDYTFCEIPLSLYINLNSRENDLINEFSFSYTALFLKSGTWYSHIHNDNKCR